jgi:hypothetical protein
MSSLNSRLKALEKKAKARNMKCLHNAQTRHEDRPCWSHEQIVRASLELEGCPMRGTPRGTVKAGRPCFVEALRREAGNGT